MRFWKFVEIFVIHAMNVKRIRIKYSQHLVVQVHSNKFSWNMFSSILGTAYWRLHGGQLPCKHSLRAFYVKTAYKQKHCRSVCYQIIARIRLKVPVFRDVTLCLWMNSTYSRIRLGGLALLGYYAAYVCSCLPGQPIGPMFKGQLVFTLISAFPLDVHEICALLGYYAASCRNCLPTFRHNVSVPSSRVKSPNRKETLDPWR
jgi:hypothetical protein